MKIKSLFSHTYHSKPCYWWISQWNIVLFGKYSTCDLDYCYGFNLCFFLFRVLTDVVNIYLYTKKKEKKKKRNCDFTPLSCNCISCNCNCRSFHLTMSISIHKSSNVTLYENVTLCLKIWLKISQHDFVYKSVTLYLPFVTLYLTIWLNNWQCVFMS